MTETVNAYLLNSPFQLGNFQPRGTWSSATTYLLGDVVLYNGSSYVALAGSTNVTPTNTTYWSVFASKGDTGATGAQGAQGPTGSAAQWFLDSNTWTYASADATNKTYTLTINADLSGTIQAGHRIWLTQSSTSKYFIVTKVSYSSPNTTLTLFGGTQYTLANSTITNPYYSAQYAPIGFPARPDYWSLTLWTPLGVDYIPSPPNNGTIVYTFANNLGQTLNGVWTSGTQYTAGKSVYYSNNTYICTVTNVSPYTTNPATDTAHWSKGSNKEFSVPIGSWVLKFKGVLFLRGTSGNFYNSVIGLGTVSGGTLTPTSGLTATISNNSQGTDAFHDVLTPFYREAILNLTSATTYNLYGAINSFSSATTTVGFGIGIGSETSVVVESAYI